MNVLALCAGGGGLELGLKLLSDDIRTVCYVEQEAYAAAALVARMEDQAMDRAPIWDDVKTFHGLKWRGVVDCITAGYPCQPFSIAGRRRGADDPRHLWPHIRRIVRQVRPSVVFIENVPNHLTLGFSEVRGELQAMDYAVEAGVFSAAEIGAPHIRKRLFALAYSRRERSQQWRIPEVLACAPRDTQGKSEERQWCGDAPSDCSSDVAYTTSARCNEWESVESESLRDEAWRPQPQRLVSESRRYAWPSEPNVCRVVNGMAFTMERDRLLGNGVVPVCAAVAFVSLWGKHMSTLELSGPSKGMAE